MEQIEQKKRRRKKTDITISLMMMEIMSLSLLSQVKSPLVALQFCQ